VGAALVADDLVSIAFTDKWQPMVPLLRVLCVFGLIRSLDVLLPPCSLLGIGPRSCSGGRWSALVMPFAFLTGAVSFGAAGVALALIVVYPIIMAWMAREALRELGIGVKILWHQLRPIASATLMMAALVLAVAGRFLVLTLLTVWRDWSSPSALVAFVYASAILRFGSARQ